MNHDEKQSSSEQLEKPSGEIGEFSQESANSFISTLQSLQMHTVANSMLPAPDLQYDLQNQFFLEQIQLRAMQSVYNRIGQNMEPHLPENSQQQKQCSVISSLSSAEADPCTTTTEDNDCDEKTKVEEWMKTVCVQSFLNPPGENSKVATYPQLNEEAQNISTPSILVAESSVGIPTETSDDHINCSKNINKHKEMYIPAEDNSSRLDYDEAHDDVENIFGLSLEGNDSRSSLIFKRPLPTNRGLSPIDFTPPDSPHEELTLDMLFGIPTQCSSVKKSSICETIMEDDSNSNALLEKHQTTDSTNSLQPNIFQTSFDPKKIPVYKQKAILMSLEAKKSAKKDDPNYDAFEFEDDEDISNSADGKRDNEVFKSAGQKITNKYVHGRGFEISNSSVNDMSSSLNKKQQFKLLGHAPDIQSEVPFHSPADTLRNRNDLRISCSFFQPSQSTNTECSKNTRISRPDEPTIPKIIIRVQQDTSSNEDFCFSKKRTKRRKTHNDDESDWEDDIDKVKKVYRTIYTIHSFGDEHQNWTGSQRAAMEFSPYLCDIVKKRLGCFGPANGILPKGTYVVCKQDLLKDDCAIWRVDNQNLLQKFPPFPGVQSDRQMYRSSSTYSGWCEQVSSQYVRVSVRIIKQNRSETTIEPEIPLKDLFPAMSTEMFRTPRSIQIKCEQLSPAPSSNCNDAQKAAFITLIGALLNQAFVVNYIESRLEKNDWSYMKSVSEIEQVNNELEQNVRKRIPLEKKYDELINEFTRITVTSSSFNSLTKCQICKKKRPRRIIQFYDRQKYNKNTLAIEVNDPTDENYFENFEVAVDAISCGRCAIAVNFLHRMRHMKLHLLRSCEEKLEEIGTSETDLSLEKSVDMAKSDSFWMNEIMKDLFDMWEDINFQFREI